MKTHFSTRIKNGGHSYKTMKHLTLVYLNRQDFETLPKAIGSKGLENISYLARETGSKLSACSQVNGTIEKGIIIKLSTINREMFSGLIFVATST